MMPTLTNDEYRRDHALTFALGRCWQLRWLAQRCARIGAKTGRPWIAGLAEDMMSMAANIAENAGFTLEELDQLSPPEKEDPT
jgi:hypothetical protein